MKKLNAPPQEHAVTEIETYYPGEFETNGYDGYNGYGAIGEQQEDEKQLFRTVFATIRNHWFLILCIVLAIVSATIFYVAQKPDYYTATARVQVNAEVNPAAGTNGDSIFYSQLNDPAYFATQLQIIEGAGLLRRVAKNLDLENNREFLNPNGDKPLTGWENVKKMFGFYRPPVIEKKSGADEVLTKNDLSLKKETDTNLSADQEAEKFAPYVSMLKNGLDVSPVKDDRTRYSETRIIEIEYTHGDPQVAAKVANTIGDAYVLQNLEQKIQTNTSAGDFLQKRVGELQSDIRRGEEQLINYAKNNSIISLDQSQNTVVQRFADLNMQLGQAQNERIAAQAAYQAALQNQMRDATVESKDPQVTGLETQLATLRQKLAQLKTEYTDEWYEVVQTKKQIETIENQLNSFRKRATNIETAALEEKLNQTIAREKALRENFERQKANVINQNEASINYKIIQQEIETNKTLLNGLLQKSRENDVVLNGTPNNVMLIDRALVPNSPDGPERTKSVFLALIMSLGVGFGVAFVIDWLNDSVKYSDDLESQIGLPILGTIPTAPNGLSGKILPVKIQGRRKSVKSYNLPAFKRPEIQESYLQLRTNLLLSTAGGAPQTILVTSGEENEGKTVTALNLARSLAEGDGKVLLIDADLRCPRIHGLTESFNQMGLTGLLTAQSFDDEAIEAAIQKDPDSNLDILTSGAHSLNAANLLSSEQMKNLIAQLSNKYSHIVIDSPPVTYFADSIILATLTDAVLIVVRNGVSSKQMILNVKKALNNVGAKIVGMIVNGIPKQWAKYYKYNNYHLYDELPANGGSDVLKL